MVSTRGENFKDKRQKNFYSTVENIYKNYKILNSKQIDLSRTLRALFIKFSR